MDSSNAALALEDTQVGVEPAASGPPAVLRGTARGLEMLVDARASTHDIIAALAKRIGEAPGFFRNNDVRVVVEFGPLATGALAELDDLAAAFELRIIEIGPAKPAPVAVPEALPSQGHLAAGSAPSIASSAFEDEAPTKIADSSLIASIEFPHSGEPLMLSDTELSPMDAPFADRDDDLPDNFEEPTQTSIPRTLAISPAELLPAAEEGPRLVVGPVRSGVILDHEGHLIVFGDVNPGAEVRATGNIVVLGRLRGTAHAGIGQDMGFILALRMEAQQLRIGRKVVRSPDCEAPTDAEIAYATEESIIVERYTGRLPRNLASSI